VRKLRRPGQGGFSEARTILAADGESTHDIQIFVNHRRRVRNPSFRIQAERLAMVRAGVWST